MNPFPLIPAIGSFSHLPRRGSQRGRVMQRNSHGCKVIVHSGLPIVPATLSCFSLVQEPSDGSLSSSCPVTRTEESSELGHLACWVPGMWCSAGEGALFGRQTCQCEAGTKRGLANIYPQEWGQMRHHAFQPSQAWLRFSASEF